MHSSSTVSLGDIEPSQEAETLSRLRKHINMPRGLNVVRSWVVQDPISSTLRQAQPQKGGRAKPKRRYVATLIIAMHVPRAGTSWRRGAGSEKVCAPLPSAQPQWNRFLLQVHEVSRARANVCHGRSHMSACHMYAKEYYQLCYATDLDQPKGAGRESNSKDTRTMPFRHSKTLRNCVYHK